MNARSRFAKGQMLMVLTLALPIILAAVGLGADLGILYLNWTILQKSADSAALAGAEYLVSSPTPPTPPSTATGCPAYTSGDTVGGPKSVACTYATYNAAKSSEFTASVPAPNPPNGVTPTIQVTLNRPNVPTYFLRFAGLSNLKVVTTATAVGPTVVNEVGNGMLPVGMPPNPNGGPNCLDPNNPSACFGTSFSLTDSYANGNWGWLDLPSGFVGSTDPNSAAHGGGATQLVTNITNGCTCTVTTGDWVYPETGEKWGPVQSAINSRTGGTSQTLSSSDANGNLTTAEAGSSRLVTVPIVDWSTANGGSNAVKVLGFAQVWLVSISKSGSSQILTVQFVKYKSSIALAGGGSNNFGAVTPPYLIQ